MQGIHFKAFLFKCIHVLYTSGHVQNTTCIIIVIITTIITILLDFPLES